MWAYWSKNNHSVYNINNKNAQIHSVCNCYQSFPQLAVSRSDSIAPGNGENIQTKHFNTFARTVSPYFCEEDVRGGWRGQNGCQEIASDGLRCSSLLSANHRKTAKATAPSTEGRCVMQSWPKMLSSFSTPPSRTLRRPKSCWSTLRGMSWRLWAHSAGRLPRLYCVTISSKSATLAWYLLPCPFAGKTLKTHKKIILCVPTVC